MQPLGPLPPEGWKREIRPGETIELPGGLGRLSLAAGNVAGIVFNDYAKPLVVSFAYGKCVLAPGMRSQPEMLRRKLQKVGIPPWLRGRVPLLFAGGSVIAYFLPSAEAARLAEGGMAALPMWSAATKLR